MRQNRTRCLWSRFRRDAEGVALVEFAMLLPVMLIAYCGVVDVVQMVMANRKVTQLTLALADLTARFGAVAPADIDNILKASESVMMPFDGTAVSMTVSSVVIDANKIAKVCWSNASKGTTPLARGTTVTLPASVNVPNTSVIMARASYDYAPITGYVLRDATYTLGNNLIYTRPRTGQAAGTANIEQVVRTGTPACPTF